MFSSEIIFEELSGKKIIKKAVSIIDNLEGSTKRTVKDVRASILGGYISGSSPAEIASSLIGSQRAKKERRYLKTISFTILHKANELSNLETFIINERYVDWIKYQTAVDDKVDDVCSKAEARSIKQELTPSEYARQGEAIPSLHWGCRCYLKPMNGEDDSFKMRINAINRKHADKVNRPNKKKSTF